MDKYDLLAWLEQQGIDERVNSDIFIAASKALTFINPEDVSATIPLTAINRFLKERYGSKVAFLDGSPTERLCQPMVDYITKAGGEVRLNAPLKQIMLDDNGRVNGFLIRGLNGAEDELLKADAYVSAMSVDALKLMLPEEWKQKTFFQKMSKLEGVEVINLHLWFDRKITEIDHLLFSRSPLLSVYADMSNTCKEYADPDKSMLELVLAPAKDWISKSDEEIIAATMAELKKLFPQHFDGENQATLLKSKVVKTPRSVYRALAGTQSVKPTQKTPIDNFYLAGSFTKQEYLGSMEGAVLSGKLAAKAIAQDYATSKPETRETAAVTI